MPAIKTHEWSPTSRGKVLGLIEGGRHSLRDITQILNIPKSTAYVIKTHGTSETKSRSGHPKLLNEMTMRRIERHIKIDDETHRQSLAVVIDLLHLTVAPRTLRRALHEHGYHFCVARRRPLLKKVDMKRRLQFAKRWVHLPVEYWRHHIWTDEMSIKLHGTRQTQDLIWRMPDEEYHKDCIDHRKKPTTGVMFWGAFRWGKVGPRHFFDLGPKERVNSTVYRDQILLGPLQDFWFESFCDVDNPIVMEDNAPVHKKVCIVTRQNLGMECWQHPPNSPDLNLIENIWHHIKHVVVTEYPNITSQSELQAVVNSIWDGFSNDQWNGLVESMPERLRAVIDAKGGSTQW